MTTTTTQDLLSAALDYAHRGWYVIPLHDVTQGHCSCGKGAQCTKPGKHPRIEDWTGDGASIDPTQIRQWWCDWPQANVGILTGERSGLAVLDVDPRNGGDLALEDLEHSYRPLPATPMVISGGGGPHHYFALDSPLGKFDPGPGLNLQADGALVVAPPSLHHSGNIYEWEASSGPDDVSLAPLPDWLRALGAPHASPPVDGVDLPETLPSVDIQALKVAHRIKYLIAMGHDPDDPQRYCHADGTPDRSRALFAVLQALLTAGHDDATLASVVMDKRYGISEKVLSQKNARNPRYWEQTKAWVAKEIARAKAKHQPPPSLSVGQQSAHPTVADMTGSAATAAHQHQNGTSAPQLWGTPGHPTLITHCAADVTPEQVQWLWKPYIALGTICMLDGDPGIGKSLLTLQLAANVSQGYPFPDQTGKPTVGAAEPANVLIMTREDSLSKTIRPRLDASGADVRRVFVSAHWLDTEGKEQAFTLKHLPLLGAELERLHPRLVVLDPVQGFLGDIDMHRANQTRPLLDALSALADKYQCAIVCIRHPAKPGESIGKALHRGLGSIDIIGAARTGLFIEQYPGDDTRALMAQTKSNLGPKGRTQGFSKHEGIFAWDRVTRLTDEDLAGSGRGPNHRAFLEAVLWLEHRLEGGLAWNASDIELEAEASDISTTLLKRAKKALAVVSAQVKGTAHPGWTWRLPPLALSPDDIPSTDSSDATDTTDSSDPSDLKTMTYEDGGVSVSEAGVSVSEASEGSEGSGGSEDGVVTEDNPESLPLISASPPGGIPAFTSFTASALWCPPCQAAQPVTEAGGVIACTVCGAQVGTTTATVAPPNGTPPAPAVAVSPRPDTLVEACPQCRCTSLMELGGSYKKCPLCSLKWRGTTAANGSSQGVII